MCVCVHVYMCAERAFPSFFGVKKIELFSSIFFKNPLVWHPQWFAATKIATKNMCVYVVVLGGIWPWPFPI